MACASLSPLKDQHKDQLQCTGGTDPVIKARVLALETQPDEGLVVDGELWAAIILKADLKVLDIIEGQCTGTRVTLRLAVTNIGYLNTGDVPIIYLKFAETYTDAPYAEWLDEE